jgi:hypothetical protein
MVELNKIHDADCLTGLPTLSDKCIDTCVTSPPYYALRDYGIEKTVWPEIRYRLFGFEIKPEYQALSENRLHDNLGLFK